MGSEWIIIIFVALVVLLGAKRLPEVARKFGKAAGEYNKTKNEVQNQFKDFSNTNLEVAGPIQNERQKLEKIAKPYCLHRLDQARLHFELPRRC